MRAIRRLSIVLLLSLSACGLVWPSHHDVRLYTDVVSWVDAGDVAKVDGAIRSDPHLVSNTVWDGQTLLHEAAAHDEAEVGRLLLTKGARADARDKDGRTALHIAAQNGSLRFIALMLEFHARLNPVDAKGWTPLDRAIEWHHPDAADLLRSKGARSGDAAG